MDGVLVSNPGYHVVTITRGDLGELSKLQEELDELLDAADQNCRIMMLLELSDLYGAMEAYLEAHFPGFGIHDIATMSFVTRRAFRNGERS